MHRWCPWATFPVPTPLPRLEIDAPRRSSGATLALCVLILHGLLVLCLCIDLIGDILNLEVLDASLVVVVGVGVDVGRRGMRSGQKLATMIIIVSDLLNGGPTDLRRRSASGSPARIGRGLLRVGMARGVTIDG